MALKKEGIAFQWYSSRMPVLKKQVHNPVVPNNPHPSPRYGKLQYSYFEAAQFENNLKDSMGRSQGARVGYYGLGEAH